MKAVKVKKKMTLRRALTLLIEGLGLLFTYLIKYLPWIALVVVFYGMQQYQNFRNYYCADLASVATQALTDEEVNYYVDKCGYDGEFYLSNVEAVRNYTHTGFRLSLILTALLVGIFPYVITYYYKREAFPPKTIRGTILVFLWWFTFTWLVSAILIYNPLYDWLKDIV